MYNMFQQIPKGMGPYCAENAELPLRMPEETESPRPKEPRYTECKFEGNLLSNLTEAMMARGQHQCYHWECEQYDTRGRTTWYPEI